MPLPANWNGIFYSKDTCGDMLFDLTPEAFTEELDARRDELSGPPPFFVGGAYTDLKLNGHHDRAKDLLGAGRKKWPTAPWDRLEKLVALVGERIGSPTESKNRRLIDTFVATLFGTWTIYPVQE